MAALFTKGTNMARKYKHWLALAAILCVMVLDHLPERAPELVLAAWNGTQISEWDSLPVMYE
ncbi:hypothetical protein [Dongia sp.]|uniref:hypothetical protein n=1 Tax=Dongia sp. TaxID=1977262 RepID=UPI0035B01D62